MILIPELETVLILTPRTGTGTLRRAVAQRYPNSILLYRHMEADGVPQGYDRWQKVGVVRHPVERLWSLYKFLRHFDGPSHDPAYSGTMRRSVNRPFSDWILDNEVVFTGPYDRAARGRFFPQYTVRHALPENRKSQFVYLRPDLGTTVYRYPELAALAERLDVPLTTQTNATACRPAPGLTAAAADYMQHCFRWDFEACGAAEGDAHGKP